MAKFRETVYIAGIFKDIFNSGICDSWKCILIVVPQHKDREKHTVGAGREWLLLDLATSSSNTLEQQQEQG